MNKMISLKNASDFEAKVVKAKKAIKNELTDDAVELRKSLIDMLDELTETEVMVDEKMLADKVVELIRAYNEDGKNDVPAAVANALASKFSSMMSKMPKAEGMTAKVKNEIAGAILKANGKQEAIDAAQAIAVKNGIENLEFNDVVDFAIVDRWGESNELFNALHKTKFSKFFYTDQDVLDAGANVWEKGQNGEKEIQNLLLNGKSMNTQYIYKRQQVALEDLDSIEEAGESSNFLRWLNDELDRQIVNYIVANLFTGNLNNIEGLNIGAPFATTLSGALNVVNARAAADAVKNPYGKEKWAIMSATQLSTLAAFKFSDTSDTIFHTKEEVAGMIGVDKIYVTDLVGNKMFVMLPDGYWIKEKNAISVSYPQYQNNVINYQKERNIAGAIHDLKSVAVLEIQ